jgi:hypothetical protein
MATLGPATQHQGDEGQSPPKAKAVYFRRMAGSEAGHGEN